MDPNAIDASTLGFDVIYGRLTFTLDKAGYEAFRDAAAAATTPSWYDFPISSVLLGPGIPIAVVPHADGVGSVTSFDFRRAKKATI